MEKQTWGIHMYKSVGTRPTDGGYVSIGWHEVGDLSKIENTREAFKDAVRKAYPSAKPGSIPVWAGVLYRFAHEIQKNDWIVYPSKIDRKVNVGKVVGLYEYNSGHNPEFNPEYPNIRKVQWFAHLPRESFKQAALYEIGSSISLFKITKYANEFINVASGKTSGTPDEEMADDVTIAKTATRQAEETTQDFIIRKLKNDIDGGYQFEHFVAHLLECMGYRTQVTQKSNDGGVDVIAHKDKLGFEPPIIKVQCKQTEGSIARDKVAQLLGDIGEDEYGLFVTLGSYSKDAYVHDRSKTKLQLIDGEKLVNLIFEHYHKLSPKYRTILPLKQIYIPDIQEDSKG